MIHRDETASAKQLAIVEKYEAFINYAYPIAQNIPRKHGIARDAFLASWRGHAQWADSRNLVTRLEREIAHASDHQHPRRS